MNKALNYNILLHRCLGKGHDHSESSQETEQKPEEGRQAHLVGFAGEAAGVRTGDTASRSRVGEDVREPYP